MMRVFLKLTQYLKYKMREMYFLVFEEKRNRFTEETNELNQKNKRIRFLDDEKSIKFASVNARDNKEEDFVHKDKFANLVNGDN